MGFDLLFFQERNQKILLDDVVGYFYNQPNFKVTPLDDDFYRFTYFNPHTEVKFMIIYNEQDTLNKNLSLDENYVYCCLYSTVNYIRPTFFAYEMMPFIESFTKHFSLLLLDPQNLELGIKTFTKEELIASYIENNTKAIEEFNEQYPLTFTSIDKTNYFYQYTTNKRIEEEYSNTNIPEINFLKNSETNEIFTAFSFDCIPSLLPKTDYVIIQKTTKGFLFFNKKELGLVPFSEILNKLSDYLQSLHLDSLELYEFKEVNANTKKLYEELPIEPIDTFEVINVDEIVDVEVSKEE